MLFVITACSRKQEWFIKYET